ncbi:VOC family protein [Lipomyces kononenkoae]|uniref:VOC family protein n=1 Tax=Lipomyces kononenkoae TaxID=34357 RepID=A0ACC3TCX2_LIPKO
MSFTTKSVYLNLPVESSSASTTFYTAIGGTHNPKFSDETAACIGLSPTVSLMLLERDRFQSFAPKSKVVADAKSSTQILICLTAESKEEVDTIVENAAKAGGNKDPTPMQDHGKMYGRSFEDLDGHVFEVTWMDPTFNPHGVEE